MTDEDRPSRDVTVEMAFEGRGSFSASGSDDAVFKALREFRSELEASPVEQKPAGKSRADEPKVSATKEEESVDAAAKPKVTLPLPPYLKEKAPKTNDAAVAVIAVWDHRKNGTEEFTAQAMVTLWQRSGRKATANLSRDVGKAATEGWLEKKAHGKYVITQFGEDFVDSLPKVAE